MGANTHHIWSMPAYVSAVGFVFVSYSSVHGSYHRMGHNVRCARVVRKVEVAGFQGGHGKVDIITGTVHAACTRCEHAVRKRPLRL